MKLRNFILSMIVFLAFVFVSVSAEAATNLKLNPNLNYSSDSNDGPLITGDNLEDGDIDKGTPTYVIFYHRECYNSKRQARRTVELYDKYKGKVDFVVVDLDTPISKEQKQLKASHYKRYIPHVTIFDSNKNVVYDQSGEVPNSKISAFLDKDLK